MELINQALEFEKSKMRNMSTSDRVVASREAKRLILALNEIYKKSKDTKLMDIMKLLTAKKKKIEKRLKGRPDPAFQIMKLNVLGTELQPCCKDPATGYFRDGYCRTTSQDTGTHIVCAIMTTEFLDYTKSKGNDLSTPIPQWQFPGLVVGSIWCLCISRWLEAEKKGVAPPVVLESTFQKALNYTSLELLKRYEAIF